MKRTVAPYLERFASQVGALGVTGQRRLRRATVLVVGTGRLGSAISTTLVSAGVGGMVLVDGQRVDSSDSNRYPFTHASDIGEPKVDALARCLGQQPNVRLQTHFSTIQDLDFETLRGIDFVVATANHVGARRLTAAIGIRLGVPQLSASLTDGREAFGGQITAWLPKRTNLACPACFLASVSLPRGESLLATVATTVGALAAHVALVLLARGSRAVPDDWGNCIEVDLARLRLESVRVLRRPDCEVCSRMEEADA